MVRRLLMTLLAVAVLFSSLRTVQAAVVISFDPAVQEVRIPTTGSTSFTLNVRLRAESGIAVVGGYDIPIDLSAPAGLGLPAGWSLAGLNSLKNFSNGAFFPGPKAFSPDEGDFMAGDITLGDGLEFGIDPVDLFSFTVDVSSAAQPGLFTASVVEGVLLGVGRFTRQEIRIENSAIIRTTAVPEPSQLALLPLLAAALTRVRSLRPSRSRTSQSSVRACP